MSPYEPCEVPDCPRSASDTEHVVNRQVGSAGGCSCPPNLVRLCRHHHALVHARPKEGTYRRLGLWNRWLEALRHAERRARGATNCGSTGKVAQLARMRQRRAEGIGR
jgi:hypothetical protein